MLLITYHTNRYKNTVVCTCQVVVQRVRLTLINICEKVWIMGLLYFPWKPQSTSVQKPERTFQLLFV